MDNMTAKESCFISDSWDTVICKCFAETYLKTLSMLTIIHKNQCKSMCQLMTFAKQPYLSSTSSMAHYKLIYQYVGGPHQHIACDTYLYCLQLRMSSLTSLDVQIGLERHPLTTFHFLAVVEMVLFFFRCSKFLSLSRSSLSVPSLVVAVCHKCVAESN